MTDFHFFAYLSRMRYIDRWALMRNSEKENIQEHSHMVAVLAHALAEIRNQYFDGEVDGGQAALAALYHDAPEILTGDLPTPIKYYNPEIRGAYQQVEQVAQEKLLSMLPEKLRAVYRPLLQQENEEIAQIVKAADKLSAYIKCLEERKAGNNEFRQAEQQTRRALEDSPLPEVAFFLKHCIPSFLLTLDELE